jgi:hypothetical protein
MITKSNKMPQGVHSKTQNQGQVTFILIYVQTSTYLKMDLKAITVLFGYMKSVLYKMIAYR